MSKAMSMAGPQRYGHDFFSHGFRPFFLLAGLIAPLGVDLWVAALAGVTVPDGPLPLMRWHAHELLVGFVGAAMVGFLLTAIPNWTGRQPYGGPKLMVLALLFVSGRLVLLPGSPVQIGAAAMLALTPLLAAYLMVLPELIKAGTKRLFVPPTLVLGVWLGDVLMLGDAAAWWAAPTWAAGQMLTANMALLLVGLIGGRIVPTFTLNALRKANRPAEPVAPSAVDGAAMAALAAVVLGDLIWPGSRFAGAIATVAAALVALRLSRWRGFRTLDQPIVWILHIAYAAVPLALALKAVSLLTGAGWAAHWLHLQTAGALTLMIAAVMTRASLGHTGRTLVVAPATVGMYATVAAAAVVRVFGPALSGASLAPFAVAAGLWTVGFGLFLWVYVPILVGPRSNG